MDGKAQDAALTALQEERARLEERLRLHDSEVSTAEGASSMETAASLREQLEQVNRLIEKR